MIVSLHSLLYERVKNMTKLVKGYTLMHEHITIDLSGVKNDIDCRLDCYEETLEEFKQLSPFKQRKYKIFRNPLIMFIL